MCESNLWFGWDNKKAGVEVLMYDITGQDPAYKTCVDNFLDQLDSAHYTPKGLIFVDNWGSNRHAGNNALLCAQVGPTYKLPEFLFSFIKIHYLSFASSLLRWATRIPSVTSLFTTKSDISLVTLEGATWSALARTLL